MANSSVLSAAVPAIGRILISTIFLVSVAGKLVNGHRRLHVFTPPALSAWAGSGCTRRFPSLLSSSSAASHWRSPVFSAYCGRRNDPAVFCIWRPLASSNLSDLNLVLSLFQERCDDRRAAADRGVWRRSLQPRRTSESREARTRSAMRLDFKDKVVLVTGAGSGIGREAALAFASRGAVVYCVGLGEQNLAETRDRILHGGGRAHAEHADVSDEAQVSALVARIAGRIWEARRRFQQRRYHRWRSPLGGLSPGRIRPPGSLRVNLKSFSRGLKSWSAAVEAGGGRCHLQYTVGRTPSPDLAACAPTQPQSTASTV